MHRRGQAKKRHTFQAGAMTRQARDCVSAGIMRGITMTMGIACFEGSDACA